MKERSGAEDWSEARLLKRAFNQVQGGYNYLRWLLLYWPDLPDAVQSKTLDCCRALADILATLYDLYLSMETRDDL